MPSIEAVAQRESPCLRCGGRFKVALPTGRGEQESLAKVYDRSRIEFLHALRESTGRGLADAKGMMQHIAPRAGTCHWCGESIRPRLLVDCPGCASLNVQLGCPVDDIACPACGFLVLSEGYGCYEICEVCGWEDDGVQLANPTSGGGANTESLAEAQARILERIPPGQGVRDGLQRDDSWRPLDAEELAEAESRRAVRHWHSRAILNPGDAYWLSKPRVDHHRD